MHSNGPICRPSWCSSRHVSPKPSNGWTALSKSIRTTRLPGLARYWLLDVDRVDEAETSFSNAGGLGAGFGGRMLKAESLVASGDAAEALPILEVLVADFPEHATLLNLIAVAYSQTGDAEKSLAVLEQAVKLAPEYYPLHLNLAGAYDDLGDAEKALDFLDGAIEVHPTFSIAHERKGVVLMRTGRYEEALLALDTAARNDARDPEVFYFAGVIESNFERWQPAIKRFQQAIEVDPAFTKAYIHGPQLRRTAPLRRRARGARQGGCAWH